MTDDRKPDASDLMLGIGGTIFALGLSGLFGIYVALLWVGLICMAVGILRSQR